MARRRFAVKCPICGKKTSVSSELDAQFIEENGCEECSESGEDEAYYEPEEEEEVLFDPYDEDEGDLDEDEDESWLN